MVLSFFNWGMQVITTCRIWSMPADCFPWSLSLPGLSDRSNHVWQPRSPLQGWHQCVALVRSPGTHICRGNHLWIGTLHPCGHGSASWTCWCWTFSSRPSSRLWLLAPDGWWQHCRTPWRTPRCGSWRRGPTLGGQTCLHWSCATASEAFWPHSWSSGPDASSTPSGGQTTFGLQSSPSQHLHSMWPVDLQSRGSSGPHDLLPPRHLPAYPGLWAHAGGFGTCTLQMVQCLECRNASVLGYVAGSHCQRSGRSSASFSHTASRRYGCSSTSTSCAACRHMWFDGDHACCPWTSWQACYARLMTLLRYPCWVPWLLWPLQYQRLLALMTCGLGFDSFTIENPQRMLLKHGPRTPPRHAPNHGALSSRSQVKAPVGLASIQGWSKRYEIVKKIVSFCLPSTGFCFVVSPLYWILFRHDYQVCLPCLLDLVSSWFPGLFPLPLSPFYWILFRRDFQVGLPLSPFYWILFRRDFWVRLPLSPFYWILFRHDFRVCLPLSPFYWILFRRDFWVRLPFSPLSPFYWILFRHDFQLCLPLSPFYWILFRHDFEVCLPLSPFHWILFRRDFWVLDLVSPWFPGLSPFVSLCPPNSFSWWGS